MSQPDVVVEMNLRATKSNDLCDGLLCSFDIHVGLESLQGMLIEPDQATAGSVQISDQRNDQSDGDREKNQRQPKARCQR
jgi:hypothetical protein